MKRRNGGLPIFFWSGLLISSFFLFSGAGKAQMGPGMMGGGMSDSGQGGGKDTAPSNGRGEEIFVRNCASCHPGGGNTIMPNLPARGAPQLADFDTFLRYLRRPTMPNGSPGPMPAFPEGRISNEEARDLYQYMTQGISGAAPGRSGYRMGPGLMGGGWGPGMMGPGYQQPFGPYRPSGKPMDAKDAREEVENYLRSIRNPNLKVGKVTEKGEYFEVDIVTKDNELVDKLVVDRKTGWMRSAY
jgi:hypothetical protein